MGRRALPAWALSALALALVAPASAGAGLPSLESACSRRDAADGNTANGVSLPFSFCDDGVPDAGGTDPNPGADRALPVPQRYAGDGFTGLPAKAAAQASSGADGNGDVALDADVSVPTGPPPAGGYPLMVLGHTCCSADKRNFEASTVDASGELWHYSNAWFASRGYVVLTYTARGFVDGQGHGSTGQSQLDSRRYEANDFQQLGCLLAASPDLDRSQPGAQQIDPRRVVISGSSYGGGLAWLALTDPSWSCGATGHADIRMRLAASAPKYGWADLLYALVPNGSHMRDQLPPGDPAGASTNKPLGMPRNSVVAALYATGKAGDPRTGGRITFTPEVERGVACLESTTPLEQNPLCTATGVVPGLLDEFLADRSPYYQSAFFAGLRRGTVAPVPVFSAGSSSSPLFGQVEHRSMVERLRASVHEYPVQEYYGDDGDFTQNKDREWGDVCGRDRHVCRLSDPATAVVRKGITTRLDRFVDHYARPPGDPNEPTPPFDVTASLQVCPPNAAAAGFPADEPGERFTESSFGELAPDRVRMTVKGDRTTQSKAAPNPHAVNDEPISNFGTNAARCPVDTTPAGPGVAVYDFEPLKSDLVMIGRPRVTVPHTGSGSDLQLDARLYELLPDGSQVLVDRGAKRLTDPNGTTVFDLQGNGWRYAKGDRLRLELTQDDDPYVKASAFPSSLTLHGTTLDLPVRRAGPDATIGAPLLASDVSTGRRFPVTVGARSGELAGVSRVEALVRDTRARRARPLGTGLYRGRPGRTYRFRARLFDRRGVPGDFATALTIVPLDDRRTRALRYRGRWKRVRSRRAWGRRLSRSSRRGASLSFRFRGDVLYLIGRTSRRGGRALVSLDGRRRRVGFRSRRAHNRRVVVRLRARRRGVHRLRLRVLRGRVEIDGFGVRRG
jgi:X-Pro dipeptidyl-peptidase-like protein